MPEHQLIVPRNSLADSAYRLYRGGDSSRTAGAILNGPSQELLRQMKTITSWRQNCFARRSAASPGAGAEIEEMMWMRGEEARGLALALLTKDSVVPLVLG